MFHPFEEDLSELKDQELQDRITDLNKKLYTAARLGKSEMLTQIETFVTIYRDEVRRRALTQKLEQDDTDLDQLINVD
jgi:hypothetical protein